MGYDLSHSSYEAKVWWWAYFLRVEMWFRSLREVEILGRRGENMRLIHFGLPFLRAGLGKWWPK